MRKVEEDAGWEGDDDDVLFSILTLFSNKMAVPRSEMNVIKVIMIGKSMLWKANGCEFHKVSPVWLSRRPKNIPQAHFLVSMVVVMALAATCTQQ